MQCRPPTKAGAEHMQARIIAHQATCKEERKETCEIKQNQKGRKNPERTGTKNIKRNEGVGGKRCHTQETER